MRAAEKLQYFAQCRPIIVLLLDRRVCFFNQYLREAKPSAAEQSQEGKMRGFHLRMSRMLFAAKNSCMSRQCPQLAFSEIP